jgi:1-acyl-sn-glycerol-3-phosphate acyltransferase
MLASIGFVVCVVPLFLLYDVLLRAARALAPDRGVDLSFRLADDIIRRLFATLRWIGGFRYLPEGAPTADMPDRFLVVANHQSLLDIIVVMSYFGSCRRVRLVSKRELGRFVPLVSSVLRIQGHALISRRGEAKQAMEELARFARLCAREGISPVIFPEGTRSRTGEVGAFHSAGVRRILEEGGGLPVVALAIDGGWKVRNILGLLRNLRGGRYRVRPAGIYPAPAGKREILDVLVRARASIAEIVERWHAEEPRAR